MNLLFSYLKNIILLKENIKKENDDIHNIILKNIIYLYFIVTNTTKLKNKIQNKNKWDLLFQNEIKQHFLEYTIIMNDLNKRKIEFFVT